ncbi:MAG TPA: SRPBCC domain-containing protein [Rhizomicrobium sp.]|jgi:uncharacterized protein YndB with AHSA1/START domain
MPQSPQPPHPRKRLTLERTFRAPIEDIWALWTTREGIESWWGPVGFDVVVRSMDLRPGGQLVYVMTATAPPQVDFMKRAGMPLSTEARITYTDVLPQQRLGYTTLADFIPGVAPYEIATLVELHANADEVRMVLTFDAMHDETWTQRALMGRESELGKLEAAIGRHDT